MQTTYKTIPGKEARRITMILKYCPRISELVTPKK